MVHEIYIAGDLEYVDGRIPAGEYTCVYEEGDFHFARVGDYIIGIHNSLLNNAINHKEVKEDVSGA